MKSKNSQLYVDVINVNPSIFFSTYILTKGKALYLIMKTEVPDII